ncbi:MEMAR_RS02690 family S-layer glycoprotein [Methanoculleus frigidifontis]|nr:MEMAR_RS02690 family S-layer glycoprotein [Methanoculleus sp. FWC-SCC1]
MQNHTRKTILLFAALIVVALLSSPAAARDGRAGIGVGDTIYTGEEGLDLTGVAPGITRLVHYSDFAAGAADNIIDVPSANTFDLSAADAGGITGTYYAWDSSGLAAGNPYVVVKTPAVTLDVVLDTSRTDSVAGKSVSRSTPLAFEVQNNVNGLYATPAVAFVDIEVTTPAGGRLTQLGGVGTDNVPINASTVYVGGIALTDAAAGTYTAQARWNDATGLAGKGYDSNTVSFEVSIRSLSLAANKDAVVRGNPFVVTVTGEAKKAYWLYVRDAGLNADQYPLIAPGQPSVTPNVQMDGVPDAADVPYAGAQVITSAAGARAVQFTTTVATADQTFTIKVVDPADPGRSDDVRVRVEMGTVTMAASGTGVYYIGEEIVLSGTNTEAATTYLFVCGPNLPTGGVRLNDFTAAVVDQVGSTFTSVSVETDDTWEYRWDTSSVNAWLDSGCYTLYAVSTPRDKAHVSDAQYATQSVVLKTPTITATASSTTVAKGDPLTISGTAEGNPGNVYVWIFGKNYRLLSKSVSVESDGSFEYGLDSGVTGNLATGQYFVVVQHPMQNGLQDVRLAPGTTATITAPGMANIDLSNLQASDAAAALVNALNSPYVEDTHVALTFLVEEPWLRIDPIGNQTPGSTFTITGTTNLAPGDELLIDVTSASFDPMAGVPYIGFSGASGAVTVQRGAPNNTWFFEVDASTFRPDEYIVNVESVETGVTCSTTFALGEGPYPTPTPVYPDSSGYTIRSVTVSPPDAGLSAGEDVAASVRVRFLQTFDPNASFEVYTDLAEPCWRIYTYRDDILISSQTRGGSRVEITAFELSYAGTVELAIQLDGTIPAVEAAGNRTLFRSQILDAAHAPVENATFTIFREFIPAPPPAPVPDATLSLARGWNFVSVQKRLSDGNNTAAKVFGAVDTAGHSFFRYDAVTRSWSALAADSAIEPLDGYWVYANRSTSVGLFFASDSVTVPPARSLAPGWNAVGHPCTVPASARDALFSVRSAWTNLIGWNAAVQEYEIAVVNGGSGIFADSRTMVPGQGYWLYMAGEGELAGLT